MTETLTRTADEPVTDAFPINGTDYIEFYVGNAKQASYYYRGAFGFQLVGYRGPETGVRDRASYLMQQDKIRFVLTTPIRPDLSEESAAIADHLARHGDGVRDLALWVDDARYAFETAIERGAVAVHEPRVMQTTTAKSSSRPSVRTATRSTRSSSAATTAGSSCPGSGP